MSLIPDSNNTPMKGAVKILVVDDEQGMRDLLSQELGSAGYRVITAANGEEALEKMRQGDISLVISDIKMPKLGGLETLAAIKKTDPDVEVIMSTGYGTIETAVAAMKKGAYDFIQKPFNTDEILALVEKALEKSELKEIIAVYEASKAIFASVQLDRLLPVILELALKILKADDASFLLIKEAGGLGMAASLGLENDQRKHARLALGERVAGKVAQWKDVIVISGPLASDPRFAGIPALRDIKSSIVCPLAIGGVALGVLSINRTVHDAPFNSSDLRSITIFAAQAAQAVHNAGLYRKLEEKIRELKEAYSQLETTREELLQSEKLTAIGQLAAGVAHELNNPLSSIMGFSELLLRGKELSAQQQDDVQVIYQQSQRCREIIQNLLQFARRKKPKKEPVQLAPLLDLVLQLLKYDLTRARVAVVKEIPGALPAVLADANQLQQVFLNLVVNAMHAMEKRSDGRLAIKFYQKAGRVIMSFEDNGAGIAKENLGKIFDPFFTTKPVGKGTGLGLSVSYGIIQEHQGAIRVESQAGGGAIFIIDLPVCPGELNEPIHHPGS